MTKTVHFGQIEEGKLSFYNEHRLMDDLRQFKPCEVEVTIRKRGKRTNQANKYYWGIIVDEIRRKFLELGNRFTAEEIHEGLKAKFNPKSIGNSQTGEELFRAGDSTTEMNKEEFGEYLERIIEWCSTDLELVIPPPNTQTSFFDLAA